MSKGRSARAAEFAFRENRERFIYFFYTYRFITRLKRVAGSFTKRLRSKPVVALTFHRHALTGAINPHHFYDLCTGNRRYGRMTCRCLNERVNGRSFTYRYHILSSGIVSSVRKSCVKSHKNHALFVSHGGLVCYKTQKLKT